MSRSGEQSQGVFQYRFGNPGAVLKVENLPPPRSPGEGEVCVRVHRAAVHPGDLQLIAGAYGGSGDVIPGGRTPGTEGSGVIEAAAPGVLADTGLEIGSRVAFFASAAWQKRVNVPVDAVVAIPDGLSDDIAAQILTNTITARHVLRVGLRGLARQPAHLLQTAAGSATGRLLTVFALEAGIRPYRLVRSPQSGERLAALLPGGDIIDTSDATWIDRVRAGCGGGVPLIIDAVGGPLIEQLLQLVSMQGYIVSYGLLEGGPADLKGVLGKVAVLRGVSIATWRCDTSAEQRAGDMAAAVQVAQQQPGLFGSPPAFALTDLGAALHAANDPKRTGNILLSF